jgi:YidC/Oxa1 family membrane protein insertase
MERRVLVAIFLCFLVIYLWQALFVKPVPKPGTQGAPSSAVGASVPSAPGTPAGQAGAGAAAGTAVPPPAVPVAPVVSPGAKALVADTSERDIRVETANVVAVFTNRGARLKSWRLKKYPNQKGEPLELVETDLPASNALPFSLRVPDAAQTATLNAALYSVKQSGTDPATAPTDLAFEYSDSAGLHAVKQFHLEPASYMLTFEDVVTSGDHALLPAIEWGPGLGETDDTGVKFRSRYGYAPRGLFSANGKEQRLAAAAITKVPSYDDTFKYAGIDVHYFMAVAYEPGKAKVTYAPLSLPPEGTGPTASARDFMGYTIEPAAPARPVKFYIGPKDFEILGAIDHDLARAVDFGMFSIIVVPLLTSLKWIFGYVHNYGWSIVLLTVIINLIIFPLRHKSVVSMRKMQEIQPETKAIQDRYAKLKATDPGKQKMNQEIMELYKQRGVNPAGGCIPMLLPFPLLIAFYSLLTTAIELRGAPFTLWIHDLTAPDPYYVFPVIMGASQLWQQWIMPAAGTDPTQRKMMMIMPLVFMFIFISYPSGMALYFLVSNVWAIGQQYFTNYWIGPAVVRSPQAAAVRRVKNAGSGKTAAAQEQKEK